MLVDVPNDWQPTAENINALPLPLRRYIMHLETHADPAFTLQELWCRTDQVAELEAALAQCKCFGQSGTAAAVPQPRRPTRARKRRIG
jgi:hypothetical protein